MCTSYYGILEAESRLVDLAIAVERLLEEIEGWPMETDVDSGKNQRWISPVLGLSHVECAELTDSKRSGEEHG